MRKVIDVKVLKEQLCIHGYSAGSSMIKRDTIDEIINELAEPDRTAELEKEIERLKEENKQMYNDSKR